MLPSRLFPIWTARLRMRPLREGDVDALAEIYQHPLVARWIGSHTRQDVEREIAQHIEHQASVGWSFWAVEHRDSGRLIGDCGLQPLEHRGPEVELGYDLHPSMWGHGLATEAAREVMRQAFGPLHLEHIIAVVKPEHVASQRVLEKVGLRHAGTREAYGEQMLLYEANRSGQATRS
jgi:ribosomal-protein-alanine N-acetyltransferase